MNAVGDIALKVEPKINTDLIDSLLRFSESMANLAKNLDIPSVIDLLLGICLYLRN